MPPTLCILLVVVSLLAPTPAAAAATIEYVFTTDQTIAGRPPVHGETHETSTIDGPVFRNVSRLGNAVELSDDDGRTTYFGAWHTTPHTPLVDDADDPSAPLAGSIKDETLVVGPSTPGPSLFGMPTRVYTVEHTYTIAVRVLQAFRKDLVNHERMTFTVADVGISSAALRVAFSRGAGHALCRHAEAFTGLPLIIDGTIESPSLTVHAHVEATSFTR